MLGKFLSLEKGCMARKRHGVIKSPLPGAMDPAFPHFLCILVFPEGSSYKFSL